MKELLHDIAQEYVESVIDDHIISLNLKTKELIRDFNCNRESTVTFEDIAASQYEEQKEIMRVYTEGPDHEEEWINSHPSK